MSIFTFQSDLLRVHLGDDSGALLRCSLFTSLVVVSALHTPDLDGGLVICTDGYSFQLLEGRQMNCEFVVGKTLEPKSRFATSAFVDGCLGKELATKCGGQLLGDDDVGFWYSLDVEGVNFYCLLIRIAICSMTILSHDIINASLVLATCIRKYLSCSINTYIFHCLGESFPISITGSNAHSSLGSLDSFGSLSFFSFVCFPCSFISLSHFSFSICLCALLISCTTSVTHGGSGVCGSYLSLRGLHFLVYFCLPSAATLGILFFSIICIFGGIIIASENSLLFLRLGTISPSLPHIGDQALIHLFINYY